MKHGCFTIQNGSARWISAPARFFLVAVAWLALFGHSLSGETANTEQAASPNRKLPWSVGPHRRTLEVTVETITHNDRQIQRFRLQNHGQHEPLILWSPQTASLLHDEFSASVVLHSTTGGIQVGLNVVLPNQSDPRTRRPLETVVGGQLTRKRSEWLTLTVAGTSSALEGQLRRLRAELNRSDIVGREAYATAIVLMLEAPPGESFVDIAVEETAIGPIVKPVNAVAQTIQPVSQKEDDAQPMESVADFIPIRVELNRVLLADQPVILRFAPDHGEPIQSMTQMGLNAVWIPDCGAAERAAKLREANLAVLATPPHPEFEPGDFTKQLQSLPPLEQLCPHASAWYTGTRVSPDELPHLLAWSRAIRSADRQFRRPQMADVTGAEGAASREVDFVGIGKHVVGREESFGQLRNELFRRQRIASQMTFPWTWIQTEPSALQQTWRQKRGATMPHVEPEQILLQAHAAISSGCKGIGFWKTRPLEIDDDLDRETAIATELVSLELQLLEPFLATGRVDGHLMIHPPATESSTVDTASGRFGQSRSLIQSAISSSRVTTSAMVDEEPAGPDAAVITSGRSVLILLTQWDKKSQYVPQAMFDKQINMIVAATETASAWRLSSTGLRALPREVVAGGLKLTVPDFDRHAAILVSSDTDLVASLERRIHDVAARSATLTVELADLKLRRIIKTTEELHEFGAVPTQVTRLFSLARNALDRGHHELSQLDYSEAAALGQQSLRYLRTIQADCWHEATSGLCSPAASPHSISFATLPDHWRMMQQIIDRSEYRTKNLLPTGNFENIQLLSESGWQKTASEIVKYSTTADVVVEQSRSNSMLQIAAWHPGQTGKAPARSDVTPVVVTSPAVAVQSGDIIRISGRIRRGRVIVPQSNRPVLLFDSEMGPEAGLRLPVSWEWEPFEFFREITKDTTFFQFSVALTCSAEINIDDVSISRFPASNGTTSPPIAVKEAESEIRPVKMTGKIRRVED
ncbi:MAG: hypothetical protein R3C20_02165 [Planctomycetaceae bacterium]